MVTIDDIMVKCVQIQEKHGMSVHGLRDLKDLAMLTIQHCQDRISQPAPRRINGNITPYIKHWGGHE
jgi:hypothetical protein